MTQMGFMNCYEHNGEKNYYFVIDSLTDFLIARSLFEDISRKEYQQQVAIIKSKTGVLYGFEGALIIAIFDNLSPDYVKIIKLLKDTELMQRLDIRDLVKVHFKRDDIEAFQENFKEIDHNELLMIMGGFTDKPFNCKNYLFEYYCGSCARIGELSNILAGYYFQNEIKNRLKNVLYFTTLNDRADRRDDEAFYFALLCCAAPNKDIRCLAVKLLYEVVSKNDGYIDKIIIEYDNILDLYIQESIIYVLSKIKCGNEKILAFYNKIISSQENLTAKSIRRIAEYRGSAYSFIMWNRKDLYKYNQNAEVSDYLNDILLNVDLMNKDFWPFRYFGKDHIDMHMQFLVNDKYEIKKINDYLYNKYACVCGGECSGWMTFEKIVMPEIELIAKLETIDMKSFFQEFENVLRYVFNYYGTLADRKSMNMREVDFNHSVYMKCVDIATGLYYGSLMCNHYTDQFATYNNRQNNIGYEVYDPLEYGEDVIITAPIPTYQDYIERLGDYVIGSLEQPLHRDIYWVKDVELTRRNLLHLIKTVKVGKQEWVLLAGRVSLYKEDMYDIKWKDTYDIWCCTSEKETIYDDGNARYLTIELEEYLDELKIYPENENKPWLCKSIKNITSQYDVFDETSLVLPPAEIIKYFNLQLNISDLSWETQAKEKVILCKINKYCSNNQVTQAVLFETALITYLSRINAENNTITIGIPVLNRNNTKEKKIAGMFISTMPLTVQVKENMTITELEQQIGKGHMEIFRHQKYPYSDILKYLREKQNFSGNLYDVMISYQNATTETDAETKWYSNGYSEVPFVVHIDNRDGKSTHTVNVDYQTVVFKYEREVEYIVSCLEYILAQIVNEASTDIKGIDIIPQEEKNLVLEQFNDTYVEYPREKCIHELFIDKAKKTPDKIALVFEDEKFTYKQLDEMSNSL